MSARSLRFALIGLIALSAPVAVSAQFQSETAKFLSAVKDGKGNDVIAMVQRPGSTIVNTKDPSTGETALHIVVKRGDTPYVVFLLQNGADLNARDDKGTTPLMLATATGQEAMVSLLLKVNANPNLANDAGETPLIRAVQRRDVQITRELLAAGANPDQTDSIAGLSAREYAKRDTRMPGLAKIFETAPKGGTARNVAGPRL